MLMSDDGCVRERGAMTGDASLLLNACMQVAKAAVVNVLAGAPGATRAAAQGPGAPSPQRSTAAHRRRRTQQRERKESTRCVLDPVVVTIVRVYAVPSNLPSSKLSGQECDNYALARRDIPHRHRCLSLSLALARVCVCL